MGLVNARPELEPGEQLRWKALANRLEGGSLMIEGQKAASGGRLCVTDRRVFYRPSRVDSLLRAKRWECPVDAVTDIEVVDRDMPEVFAGGMRDRLGIRTADGVEVFVVNHLEKKMAELRPLFPRVS